MIIWRSRPCGDRTFFAFFGVFGDSDEPLTGQTAELKERNGTGKAPSTKQKDGEEEGREDLAPPDRWMRSMEPGGGHRGETKD